MSARVMGVATRDKGSCTAALIVEGALRGALNALGCEGLAAMWAVEERRRRCWLEEMEGASCIAAALVVVAILSCGKFVLRVFSGLSGSGRAVAGDGTAREEALPDPRGRGGRARVRKAGRGHQELYIVAAIAALEGHFPPLESSRRPRQRAEVGGRAFVHAGIRAILSNRRPRGGADQSPLSNFPEHRFSSLASVRISA